MRCSCGSRSSPGGGWPCSSRIAFRRCGWPTGSWCSRAASGWTRGRTRSWWRGAGCTRSCSACRRRGIGDRPCPARGGDRIRSQGGAAWFLAHLDLVLSRARRGAECPRSSGVLARSRLCNPSAGCADLRLERRRRLRGGSIQPAQGNVPVWGARHTGTTRAVAMADRVRAAAVCDPAHAITRTQGARVVRGAYRCHRDLQLSAVRVQRTPRARRAEPGGLPARLRPRELAEPCLPGAMVHVPVRCHVRDALPSVRRNHGFGTRSTRRPSDARGCPACKASKWLLIAFLAVEAVLIGTCARDPWLAAF